MLFIIVCLCPNRKAPPHSTWFKFLVKNSVRILSTFTEYYKCTSFIRCISAETFSHTKWYVYASVYVEDSNTQIFKYLDANAFSYIFYNIYNRISIDHKIVHLQRTKSKLNWQESYTESGNGKIVERVCLFYSTTTTTLTEVEPENWNWTL